VLKIILRPNLERPLPSSPVPGGEILEAAPLQPAALEPLGCLRHVGRKDMKRRTAAVMIR
jgi:hypothetical protein